MSHTSFYVESDAIGIGQHSPRGREDGNAAVSAVVSLPLSHFYPEQNAKDLWTLNGNITACWDGAPVDGRPLRGRMRWRV